MASKAYQQRKPAVPRPVSGKAVPAVNAGIRTGGPGSKAAAGKAAAATTHGKAAAAVAATTTSEAAATGPEGTGRGPRRRRRARWCGGDADRAGVALAAVGTVAGAGGWGRSRWRRRVRPAADDATLRAFDLDARFGPCLGITRLQRWERAAKNGLHPPAEVKRLLDTSGGDATRKENLWHDFKDVL